MSEKTIGIVGGMGPEATLNCFSKILANTPADRDQDHLRILIDNNPKIPDRTRAMLGDGESPVPAILESCHALQRAGGGFHYRPLRDRALLFRGILRGLPLPVISILDVAAQAIAERRPDVKRIGLMATNGTVQSGIFQKRLARDDMKPCFWKPIASRA